MSRGYPFWWGQTAGMHGGRGGWTSSRNWWSLGRPSPTHWELDIEYLRMQITMPFVLPCNKTFLVPRVGNHIKIYFTRPWVERKETSWYSVYVRCKLLPISILLYLPVAHYTKSSQGTRFTNPDEDVLPLTLQGWKELEWICWRRDNSIFRLNEENVLQVNPEFP